MLTPDRNIIPRDALNKKKRPINLAKAIQRRIGITMSREAELLRLADVCYSQANATLSRAEKRALREMGITINTKPNGCGNKHRRIATL